MKRFTLGSTSIGDLEKKYVMEVLDNNYISPGPVVKHVEDECARLHNKKFGLALNSGQSAIHVALQAIIKTKIRDCNKSSPISTKPLVAVPACTYISTLAAAILAGCDVVLVDVDMTGNMSPSCLRKVLKQASICDPIDIVIPVHLFGQACSLDIFAICKEFDAWIVEDACEATFAPYVGGGHILTTSFFSNHLISAGGGGMIMTDDPELDEYCWKLVNHGRSARFGNDDIHKIAEKFHFDTWGHSFKWNDVSAAIAKAQIERRDELYGARQDNANRLFEYIGEWQERNVITLPYHDEHVFMMYPIILHKQLDASKIIHCLNEYRIEVRRMMPITNQPVVQEYFHNDLAKDFPVADLINRQGFYVGCHPELSLDDMAVMGDIIYQAIQEEVDRVNL